MKARVTVMLKDGVLDPQGEAVKNALKSLEYNKVESVRQGKVIEIRLDENSEERANKSIQEMCEKLLANTVIESFEIDRKASENKNIVSFELTTVIDKPNEYIPRRQLIGNCCQWQYRSSECSYTGSNYFDKNDNVVNTLAADVCGKRLSSCKKRFGENGVLPFGSFPTAGKTQ